MQLRGFNNQYQLLQLYTRIKLEIKKNYLDILQNAIMSKYSFLSKKSCIGFKQT